MILSTQRLVLYGDKRADMLDRYSQRSNIYINRESFFLLQNIGGDISKYKNIAEWYDRCKSLPGFEENNEGGKIFGERVRSRLVDKL